MPVNRVIALGASNLTRGFPTLLATARAAWGPDVEVILALGLGRSYGVPSRIGVRTLPGILQSGLWADLERRPRVETRGLITDVGNDILYGSSASEILAWVGQSASRIEELAGSVVVTGLPLASLERVPHGKFLFFRSLLVPRCRLSRDAILDTARRVDAGLAELAAKRGFRFVTLPGAWYGFDPVHVRPGRCQEAWTEILCGGEPHAGRGTSWAETVRLQALSPERQRLFGFERVVPQRGVFLPAGGRVWLY